jgi:fido (protein-threonine AMPylation protein)
MWPDVEADAASRPAPSLAVALGWHRQIYAGVAVPHPDYVGNVRDRDPSLPCLIDYEVGVGSAPGVLAHDVPGELDAFFRAATTVTSTLDRAIPGGGLPTTPATISAVIRLCAQAHGEWIRVHPFANGNGRTARVWANWFALRYGLPPFVRIKPRPADVQFFGAAQLSMRRDHRPTEAMFAGMLTDALLAVASTP